MDKTSHSGPGLRGSFRHNSQPPDLVVENALLRQQLIVLKRQVKRSQLTDPDRFRLVLLSHFTKFWKQSLHIVQPETLLRWHCELFRDYWRRKSQGEPKISPETISLIQKIAKKNHLWGAERIRGELLKLRDFPEEPSQWHLDM